MSQKAYADAESIRNDMLRVIPKETAEYVEHMRKKAGVDQRRKQHSIPRVSDLNIVKNRMIEYVLFFQLNLRILGEFPLFLRGLEGFHTEAGLCSLTAASDYVFFLLSFPLPQDFNQFKLLEFLNKT